MFKSEFHIHTNFVDGANTPEEMVLSAISKGLTTLGFSEHAYVPFDREYSMSIDEHRLYKEEISRLKEKYADKINILCGLEMDYYSEIDTREYDYIIGSVHYFLFKDECYPVDMSPKDTMKIIERCFGGDTDSYAEWYFEMVSKIYEKTSADIIGHIDLITKFKDFGSPIDTNSSRYASAYKSAMDALNGKAVLEINTGAISRGYRQTPYPDAEILKYWHKLGGGVILSGDAHNIDSVAYKFDEAMKMAETVGFKTFGFTDKKGNKYTQI